MVRTRYKSGGEKKENLLKRMSAKPAAMFILLAAVISTAILSTGISLSKYVFNITYPITTVSSDRFITAIGAITGTPKEGEILTAGALTPTGATAAYRWQKAAAYDGTYADISGAELQTYTPVTGDVNYYIRVIATGSGDYSGYAISAYTGPIQSAAVPLTAIADITGSADVGSMLSAGAISPEGAAASYKWSKCETYGGVYTDIDGAVSSTYTLKAADYNYYIKVSATGTGGYTGTVTSNYAGPVQPGEITAIGGIIGSTTVDQTVTAGALTPAGAAATYQWQRSTSSGGEYSDITGATSSSYTLVSGDYNYYIRVVASGTGPEYTGTVTSAVAGPVSMNPTPITAIADIQGVPQVGVTLTAGALTPAGATATYQWKRSQTSSGAYVNIEGATETTYIPVAEDYSYYIKVQATGSGPYTGSLESAFTGPVAAAPLTAIGNIVGVTEVGQALTAGTLTPAGATADYQWIRSLSQETGYEAITGATYSSYTVSAGDADYYIKVTATGTNGYSGSVTSAAAGPVVQNSTPLESIGAITGTAKIGVQLNAGSIEPAGATVAYQWKRATSSDGSYTNISGATSSSYTPVAGDHNYYIKVSATGTGIYSGTVTSSYTGPVAAADLISIGNISGTTTVGQTLTAGALQPAGATASYQWMRAGTAGGTYSNISGATSSSYTLTSADRGSYIKVSATGTGAYAGTVTSNYTGPVTRDSTPITAIGDITGTPQTGMTLTAGALSPSGATATYQWQISTASGGPYGDISGATSNTYIPVLDDYNKYIRVVATGSGAYEGTVTSNSVGPVTTYTLVSIGNISGTAQVGSVLSAGTLTPPGATASYQWLRSQTSGGDYSAISGATSSNYTVAAGDIGYYIKVAATGSGDYSGSVTSNYIGPVVSSAISLESVGNISGTVKVDNMLTAGVLAPAGATATYQWQRSTTSGGAYTDISGATSNTYTPGVGDLNYYIRVVATGSGSYTGTVTSQPVGPVGACTIYIQPITGVTVPVKNQAPDMTVDETSQYTASITWSPTPPGGKFRNNVVYTATITLTAKTGYTLSGVPADYFTVAGATSVTNNAGAGIVTAVFPAAK